MDDVKKRMIEALEAADSRLGGLENSIATDDLESYLSERRARRAVIKEARGPQR